MEHGKQPEIKWYNLARYVNSSYTFIISIGGRGIGKTYSMMDYLSNPERTSRFLYLRRMDTEYKISCTEAGNPFKKINEDKGRNVEIKNSRNVGVIHTGDIHNPIGYASSLSSCGSLRGFDMSDVDIIFFDECVGQKGHREFKNEADNFFNLYETVNRNRELFGEPPVKVIMASNAVSLNSQIFAQLGIIRTIEIMVNTGQERYRDRERSLLIDIPNVTSIRNKKENTALYRLTKGTKFKEHALDNKFSYDSFFNIRRCPLDEFYAFCGFGNTYIYRHKTNGTFYACGVRADCPYYSDSKEGRILFKRLMFKYKDYLYDGRMKFEDYQTKIVIWEAITGEQV